MQQTDTGRALAGTALVALVGLALLAPGPRASMVTSKPAPELEIVEPRPDTIVAGHQKVVARLTPSLEKRLVRLDCLVDGQLIGSTSRPPYVFEFETRGAPQPHTIELLAAERGGATLSARVTTSPLKIDLAASVREVIVPVAVLDASHRFAADLGPQDLRAYDGDVPLVLRDRWVAQIPLRLAILIDASSSMHDRIHAARRVVDRILDDLNAEDRTSLSSFLAVPDLLASFEQPSSRTARASADLTVSHQGFTGIYDSVEQSLREQFPAPEPDTAFGILVVTDGLDTVSRTAPAQVSALALERGIPLYVVGIRSPGDETERQLPAEERLAHRKLSAWAEKTHGRAFYTSSGRDLDDELLQMLRDLRSRHMLSLEPPQGRESIENLRVEASRPDLSVWVPPLPTPATTASSP